MAVQIGQTRFIAYNSNTYESPTWVEIDLTKDCKVTMSHGESDASFRGYGGFSAMEPGLTSLSFEFNIIEDRASSVYTALRTAFLAKTSLDIFASNTDPTTGSPTGPRATCKVFKFDAGETLGDVVTIDVVLKPCYSSHAPEWYAP